MEGISKRFGATVALDRVDFSIGLGEVHALVGENGSGKSTLMRILAGALHPDAGQMWIGGKPYLPRQPRDARNVGIGMIHQELSLCDHLSVVENILLGMEKHRVGVLDCAAMKRMAQSALEFLGYADLDVNALVGSLSIGARQVVEIARSIAVGCKVVVLDEPTSSLTETDSNTLFRVIDRLRKEGHAIIYISHFLDEVFRIADRVTVLRDGQMVGVQPAAELNTESLVSMMVGRKIESLYPRTERIPREVVLAVQALGGKKSPANASFELHAGEVLGIAGLNGAGRSELIRCIFGLDAVRRGTVRVGMMTGKGTPHRRWSQGLGMLSEDRKTEGLVLNLTISDNVTLTSLDRFGKFGFVRPSKLNGQTDRWVRELAIKCQGPSQVVGSLSGGNQQKVALARLLQHDVDILLLDEPTRGIDVGSKELIYRMIDKAAHEGKAILMVSSYLPELLGVCDRIAVMHKGVLGSAKAVSDTSQEELMKEATGS
jgi:ribose transport system ATP-binding protein